MSTQINYSITRIYDNRGVIVGAGFLVSDRLILTCAHVISQALGLQDNQYSTDDVFLDFPLVTPSKKIKAHPIIGKPTLGDGNTDLEYGEDIAVLKIDDPLPAGTQPAPLVKIENNSSLWGHNFRVVGFSKESPNGTWVHGKIRDVQADGWIQIDKENQKGYSVEQGFSGAPVWDEELNAIIGIIVAIDKRDEIGSAYIIPGSLMITAWPELINFTIQQTVKYSSIKFTHGYSLPSNWAPRDAELSELAKVLSSRHDSVTCIIGIGGAGKSSLARKLIEDLPWDNTLFEACLWFSFYIESDFDRFLAEAGQFLIPEFKPRNYPSPFEKLNMLREVLKEKKCLLILDGIETMLVDDADSPRHGACKSRVLRDFLIGMCSSDGLSQVLITSRYPPTDIVGLAGYKEVKLSGFDPKVAIKYMRQQGIRGDEAFIAEVCAYCGYHALTLYVLADYLLQPPFHGDIRGVKSIESLGKLPEETPQGVKLHSILEGYWEKLSIAERYFMTRLSAFRTGASENALPIMAVDLIGNPCQTTNPDFHLTLRRLRQSSLIQIESYETKRRYTTHPLIKTYFYEKLTLDEQQNIHLKIKEYMDSLPVVEKPHYLEDVDPLIESYYHSVKAGLYDEAYQIYKDGRLGNWLFWWGHYSLSFELLQSLLDAYSNRIWLAPIEKIVYIYKEAGSISAKSIHTDQAARFYQQALNIAETSVQKSKPAQYLSEVLAEAGKFFEAFKALEEAKSIEEQMGIGVSYQILGRQGYFDAAIGNVKKAEKELSEAIKMSSDKHQGDAGYLCLFLRIRGDLYVNIKKFLEAEEDYARALEIALDPSNNFKDYEGHILRGLGDLYRIQNYYEQSKNNYDKALVIAKNTGYLWLEAESRIGLALIAFENGDVVEAIYEANRALQIAMSGGWLVQQIHAHIVLANISLLQSDLNGAKNHVGIATNIVEESGYFWFRSQLCDLVEDIMEGR